MTGFNKPTHTQTPNELFDDLLRDMSEAELKVTLIAIRKTLGYHKRYDPISLSQFVSLTGLSRQAVIDGIEAAVQRGTLRRIGQGKRGVSIFELVMTDDQSTELTSETRDWSTELTSTGLLSRHTKETLQKKEKTLSSGDESGTSKKRTRKADPFYDAISATWNTQAGGWIGNLKAMLSGTAKRGEWARCNFDPPVTDAAEITDFAAYMRRRMADKHMDAPPTACVTIQRWFYDFRAEQQRRAQTGGYVPVAQRRSALDFVQVVNS